MRREMNMSNLTFSKIKKAIFVMLAALAVMAVILVVIAVSVAGYNNEEHVWKIGDDSKSGVSLVIEVSQGWDKIMPTDFQYPETFEDDSFTRIGDDGNNISYGRTCEFSVTNQTEMIVRDWTLTIPVKEDMYIDKAWNGKVYLSQFAGKYEDTVDLMKASSDSSKLESAVVDELLLFPVQKGDSIVYYPSKDFFEYPLSASDFSTGNIASTKVGFIFYTEDENIDLNDSYITYHFGKKMADVPAVRLIVSIMIVLLLLLLVSVIEIIIGNRYLMIKKAADEKAQRELGAALRAAEEANMAKTVFLNNMSHDIRTPMNAIIGFTDLLEKNIDDKEKVKDYLKKIKSSNEFLLSLINNVLEMARIESGKTVLVNKQCNISELFQGISDVFAEQMQEKNISFNSSITLEHKHVLCDKTKLREIYLNILSNALKYTNPGGKVDFIITEEKSELENSVIYKAVFADNGIGMTKEYLDTIYEQFSREHSTTEGGVTGTGLGMSIVKKLVDLMKGHIHIESEPGKGTTITVLLPFELSEEEIEDESDINIDEMMSVFKGKRILMAEDNSLNAEIAMAILEEAGLEVEHAIDGEECVGMLEEHDAGYYDMIITDIQMPRLNGYDAARHIRNMDDVGKASIPIVAMTANAFVEDIKRSIEAGMNGHITKPIVREEVFKAIAKVLNNEL